MDYETLCCTDVGMLDPEEQALYARIDEAVEKYKGHDGALIMVLHEAQEIYGYLPEHLQFYVADKMGIPMSDVSGVVSFYSFFTTKKRGKHTIRVCQGTACYVRGGKRLVQAIKDELDVEVGDTTEDELFTFEIARCIGACGLAPAIMIDDDVYKQMTPEKLHILLNKYRKAEKEAAKAAAAAAAEADAADKAEPAEEEDEEGGMVS